MGHLCGAVAQWIEHRSSKPRVAGSTPARPANLVADNQRLSVWGKPGCPVDVATFSMSHHTTIAVRRFGGALGVKKVVVSLVDFEIPAKSRKRLVWSAKGGPPWVVPIEARLNSERCQHRCGLHLELVVLFRRIILEKPVG